MIRKIIAVAALTFVIVAINFSIVRKEDHLETGRVVFLELAPVDPRSLMQGDYMALRFKAANELRKALPKLKESNSWWRKVDAEDGWAVLSVDERGVGQFKAVAATPKPTNHESTNDVPAKHGSASDQIHLAFRVRAGTIKFATNAFFFQEGTGTVYERARYGEFRVNDQGEPLLVGLRDENLAALEVSSGDAE